RSCRSRIYCSRWGNSIRGIGYRLGVWGFIDADVQDSVCARYRYRNFSSRSSFASSIFEKTAADYSLRWDAFDSPQTAFGGIPLFQRILGVLSAVSRGLGEWRQISRALPAPGYSRCDQRTFETISGTR